MNERIVIATKGRANLSNPKIGLLNAIAEDVDGKIVSVTDQSFCPTRQVFIVGDYEEIEEKFQDGDFFKIRVELNQSQTGPCKYKAFSATAQKLRPNDIAEVIRGNLPDKNYRRLSVDSLPAVKFIFIQNTSDDLCYGPFDWDVKSSSDDGFEIELKIVTGGSFGQFGGTRQIFKISSKKSSNAIFVLNSVAVDKVSRKLFLQNISNIVAGADLEDYANDKEVVEYIKSLAGESVGRRIDRKNLNDLAMLVGSGRPGLDQFRRNRVSAFKQIIATNIDILDDINEWFEGYLKSELGGKIVEEYVQKNRGKYIDKLKDEKATELGEQIKLKRDELEQIRKSVDDFRKQRTILSDEIENKRKSKEEDIVANQNAYIEKVSEQTQIKIQEINAELISREKKLEEIEVRIGKISEIDDVKKLVNRQQGVLDYIQSEIKAKTKELDAILDESRKADDEIRKKLRGMKPYVDHLNGSFSGGEFKQLDIKVICNSIDCKQESLIHAQRAILKTVKTHLVEFGRTLEDQDVANILISTQQSFITFFAGLPGVGKTSLCKLMVKSLGVDKRLLSVSVARGWTSIRDMVGFHNPLNDRFQPASTGMYEFLHALHAEKKAGGSHPMSYILLDEANLSSIEHYWSAFMGMADATTSQNLPIGGQDTLEIPRHLRFLATINYDGTTEPLSPRILNRAGVIVMRPGEIASRSSVDVSALQTMPVSSEHMDTLFGLFKESPDLESVEKSALEDVRKILGDTSVDKGRSIHISQRKINAIRQYCGRARPIMRSDGNELTALDWAILQHVLPQVSGHGKKFGDRLLSLKKCFENHNLEKSAEYLEQMISSGQNDLHSYEFFCW